MSSSDAANATRRRRMGWFDIVANVLLFVPLGFLYPLTRAAQDEVSPGHVFFLGLLLSAAA